MGGRVVFGLSALSVQRGTRLLSMCEAAGVIWNVTFCYTKWPASREVTRNRPASRHYFKIVLDHGIKEPTSKCAHLKKKICQRILPHIWKVPVECVPFRFTSYPFFQKHPRKGGLTFEPLSYPTFLLLSDLPSFFSSQDPLKVSTMMMGILQPQVSSEILSYLE